MHGCVVVGACVLSLCVCVCFEGKEKGRGGFGVCSCEFLNVLHECKCGKCGRCVYDVYSLVQEAII